MKGHSVGWALLINSSFHQAISITVILQSQVGAALFLSFQQLCIMLQHRDKAGEYPQMSKDQVETLKREAQKLLEHETTLYDASKYIIHGNQVPWKL